MFTKYHILILTSVSVDKHQRNLTGYHCSIFGSAELWSETIPRKSQACLLTRTPSLLSYLHINSSLNQVLQTTSMSKLNFLAMNKASTGILTKSLFSLASEKQHEVMKKTIAKGLNDEVWMRNWIAHSPLQDFLKKQPLGNSYNCCEEVFFDAAKWWTSVQNRATIAFLCVSRVCLPAGEFHFGNHR